MSKLRIKFATFTILFVFLLIRFMQYNRYLDYDSISVNVSSFEKERGVSEFHIMIQVTNQMLSFDQQLDNILTTYNSILNDKLENANPVFERYFLSDAAIQQSLLKERLFNQDSNHAVSIIEQAPLNGTKIALWAYLQTEVSCLHAVDNLYQVSHGSYQHLWSSSNTNTGGSSKKQTKQLFLDYSESLNELNCSLSDNCIRTWLFVKNIDDNYKGMVVGRNDVFATHNLSVDTHFIASTGIGGRTAEKESYVMLDAYAVNGLKESQVGYLYARTHFNSTAEYGVSFERGTYVDYGDRRHVFISGTASINNKGEIMYPGDIRKQANRMIENVEKLLEEAGCNWGNVGPMIVYLRDPADYTVVSKLFSDRFPDKPWVVVLAPVCRLGWLVEMECMAIREQDNTSFESY